MFCRCYLITKVDLDLDPDMQISSDPTGPGSGPIILQFKKDKKTG
jgi:hypothetical protein